MQAVKDAMEDSRLRISSTLSQVRRSEPANTEIGKAAKNPAVRHRETKKIREKGRKSPQIDLKEPVYLIGPLPTALLKLRRRTKLQRKLSEKEQEDYIYNNGTGD